MESVLIGVIVAAAAGYLLWLARGLLRSSPSGCGSQCHGCQTPGASNFVDLDQLKVSGQEHAK